MIDFEKYGFYVCGEARDEHSAREKIGELLPDIVIMDTCLTAADGSSLIELINLQYPYSQIIILSCCDDCNQLRDSMKYGTVDCLQKNELAEAAVIDALLAARYRINQQKALKGKANDDGSLLRRLAVKQQYFLKNFLQGEGRYDTKNLKNTFAEYGLPYPNYLIMVAVAAIDEMRRHKSENNQHQWEIIFNRAIDISESIVAEAIGGIVIPQSNDRFIILFHPREQYSYMRFLNKVNDCIAQLRSALSIHCNLTACYSLSGIIENATLIPSAYKTANALIDERIYHGYDQIITEKSPMPAQGSGEPYNISIQDEYNITKFLKVMDIDALNCYINRIFDDRKKRRIDSSRLQIVLAELLHLLNRELRENNLDIMEIYSSYNKIFENIQYMTLEEMKQCVLEYYRNALDAIKKIGYNEEFHMATNRACIFINQHYARDISVNDIAEVIGVTPSYLSRVFKKDRAQTVVGYLNKVRVEHAKKLVIDSNISFKKISELVGFNSITYFFTVFKQYAGETPSQYRQRININT